MREVTPNDKPQRMRWIRGADGRVKRASDGRTIGDIWAEQRRIQLSTVISEDERRIHKRATRKALVGRLISILKALPKTAQKKMTRVRATVTSVPSILKLLRPLRRLLGRFSTRQRLVGGGIAVAVLFLLITGPSLSSSGKGDLKKKTTITSTRVLDSKTQRPDYATILPGRKTIEQLGGWGRVSPPDKDPVFAYADQIAGVRVTVSEQPVPASFKKDVKGNTADLAKQFNATDAVTAGDITFYIGTSAKGPQSVILTEHDLLVLIKSDSKLTNQQWADYIASLH